MRYHRRFRVGARILFRELWGFFLNPIFFIVTIVGNAVTILSSFLFYFLERDVNPMLDTVFEAVYLSFLTVTTVGYGDVHPVTVAGRIVSIVLMLFGSLLFLSYIALFAQVFARVELLELETKPDKSDEDS